VGRRLRHGLIVPSEFVSFVPQQTIVLNPRVVERFSVGIELMRLGGVFDPSCLRNAARDLVWISLGYLARQTASSFVGFRPQVIFQEIS
jgi:hypothetical protein